ncbi:HdeD family acid-resistance protein [Bradyrhizobium sp. RDM12]
MTTYDHSAPMGATGLPQPPRWVCVLLGLFMVFTGLMVLGDVAFFTVISALFIGWMAIATGAFEIFHAFWTKGWGGFVWQVVLGALYMAFGIVLISQPLTGALLLSYALGLALLVSESSVC